MRKASGARKTEIEREHVLANCHLAAESVARRDDIGLRDFVVNQLRMRATWGPIVAMALLERRWARAKDPVAYIKTVCRRLALKWLPDLRGMDHIDNRKPMRSGLGHIENAVSEVMPAKRASRDSGDSDFRDNSYYAFIDSKFANSDSDRMDDRRLSTRYVKGYEGPIDWASVMPDLGVFFDDEELALLDIRARGVTKERTAAELLWDPARVERVWRRISRKLEKKSKKNSGRVSPFATFEHTYELESEISVQPARVIIVRHKPLRNCLIRGSEHHWGSVCADCGYVLGANDYEHVDRKTSISRCLRCCGCVDLSR